jgi:WXG100 family type VII secretion target
MTFQRAVDAVREAADRLGEDRDRVAGRVDDLLDTGWQGAAARAYAEGWDDWKRSADAVLHGLSTMAELLDAVHTDVTTTDGASGSGLDRLAARLG